jgi:hypothetical protein
VSHVKETRRKSNAGAVITRAAGSSGTNRGCLFDGNGDGNGDGNRGELWRMLANVGGRSIVT